MVSTLVENNKNLPTDGSGKKLFQDMTKKEKLGYFYEMHEFIKTHGKSGRLEAANGEGAWGEFTRSNGKPDSPGKLKFADLSSEPFEPGPLVSYYENVFNETHLLVEKQARRLPDAISSVGYGTPGIQFELEGYGALTVEIDIRKWNGALKITHTTEK